MNVESRVALSWPRPEDEEARSLRTDTVDRFEVFRSTRSQIQFRGRQLAEATLDLRVVTAANVADDKAEVLFLDQDSEELEREMLLPVRVELIHHALGKFRGLAGHDHGVDQPRLSFREIQNIRSPVSCSAMNSRAFS